MVYNHPHSLGNLMLTFLLWQKLSQQTETLSKSWKIRQIIYRISWTIAWSRKVRKSKRLRKS